jgi:hypothetical protein
MLNLVQNRLPKFVTGETLWLTSDYYSGPVMILHAYHDSMKFFGGIKDVGYFVKFPIAIDFEKSSGVRYSGREQFVPEKNLSRIEG